MLILHPLLQDEPWANGYLLIEGHEAILIDATDYSHQVKAWLTERKLDLKAIFLTHGHADHIVGLEPWVHHAIPIYLHPSDERFLHDEVANGSADLPNHVKFRIKTTQVKHLDRINWLGYSIEVIHTPFHTPGSVCYYLEKDHLLFSGDTLFKQGIGRDDLPHSQPHLVKASLSKLLRLPAHTEVYPGHGPSTTIQKESTYLKRFTL